MVSDGTWTYTWEHGRQLASMSKSGTNWSFTYDANGMRTKRWSGSTTYSYIYNGSQLSYMSVGSNELYFSYDGMGIPLKVVYNGIQYHYITNLQGDIIRIQDENMNPVVTYTYDAWGNLLSTTGTMASTLGVHNPLRYRGYVYDAETELYYLQSRYYNPNRGRFINADVLVSTGQGVLGNNMFAYCNNNPVVYADPSGHALVVCLKDDHDPTLGMFVRLTGGGGGGGMAYLASISPEAVKKLANNVGGAIRVGAEVCLDAAATVYNYLVETETLDMGMNTFDFVKANVAFKKSWAYFVVPIPTPIDEALGVGYALKGLYYLAKIWGREIE